MSQSEESASCADNTQVTRVVTPTRSPILQAMPQDNADVTANTIATNGASPLPLRSSPAPQPPSGKPPAIPNGSTTSASLNEQTSSGPHSITTRDPKAAAAAASDNRNIVRRKLTGFVGFANLPNQWHRKSVRKGFNFNVMVVGKQCIVCSHTVHI